MNPVSELREAILEGMAIELVPDDSGWKARVGLLDHEVFGGTAADVLRTLAAILERR